MRKVTVDPSQNVITAQGGCLITDVDHAAADLGLAFGWLPLFLLTAVSGTVSHTGIGGLTLGGGKGFLTGEFGYNFP
jgi:FAD/FMN-containing dehydrogenase